MHTRIQELVIILHSEEQVMNEFLKLSNLQKEYLETNKIDEYRNTVIQQDELFNRIKDCEQQRVLKIAAIAYIMCLDINDISIECLINNVTSEKLSEELKILKNNLSLLSEEIQKKSIEIKNLINKKLNQYLKL